MRLGSEYKEAKPIITVALAFIISLRQPLWMKKDCVKQAQEWLKLLEQEVE